MRDGVVLLADHYAPVAAGPRPTVLMRCPYGRGVLYSMTAVQYAEHGYHVLLQSTRGTYGSGGAFRPYAGEAADGQDTVAWLRAQDWFDGRLATAGSSYLSYVQWALALDPPPELRAMVIQAGPHDYGAAVFGRGPFELYNRLSWSEQMAHRDERGGAVRLLRAAFRREERIAPMLRKLPLSATGDSIGGTGAPWYAEWLAHPDLADPYWEFRRATAALDAVSVPTLLIGGFHDLFFEQTMQQYQALRRRGVPAGLTVGPWTHLNADIGLAVRETLAWLDAFAAGDGPSPRPQPVRAWTSGSGQWSELPAWPPAGTVPRTWYLHDVGRLTDDQAVARGVSRFQYDPLEPTPSLGGRTSSSTGGSRDNTALEARDDVLTFSTAPLTEPVQVAGVPSVRLYVRCIGSSADIFARLCDVDEDGHSLNLTDQITRLAQAEVASGQGISVSLSLPDLSHVFLPGHRIRLQLSGGAFPRYARNLGTAADPVTGTETAVVSYSVLHGAQQPSALVLPCLTNDKDGGPGTVQSS
jgi:hypothetical protein